MQKTLIVEWIKTPSGVAKYVKENKIKQKDIVSIGRLPSGEIEIWYFKKQTRS